MKKEILLLLLFPAYLLAEDDYHKVVDEKDIMTSEVSVYGFDKNMKETVLWYFAEGEIHYMEAYRQNTNPMNCICWIDHVQFPVKAFNSVMWHAKEYNPNPVPDPTPDPDPEPEPENII